MSLWKGTGTILNVEQLSDRESHSEESTTVQKTGKSMSTYVNYQELFHNHSRKYYSKLSSRYKKTISDRIRMDESRDCVLTQNKEQEEISERRSSRSFIRDSLSLSAKLTRYESVFSRSPEMVSV